MEALKLSYNAIQLCLESYIKKRETMINDSLFVGFNTAVMTAVASNGKKPEYEPIRLTPKTEEEIEEEKLQKEKALDIMYDMLREELERNEKILNASDGVGDTDG